MNPIILLSLSNLDFSLGYNKLSDTAGCAIADALKSNATLTSLK